LPWSTWAMIAMLRMFIQGVRVGGRMVRRKKVAVA